MLKVTPPERDKSPMSGQVHLALTSPVLPIALPSFSHVPPPVFRSPSLNPSSEVGKVLRDGAHLLHGDLGAPWSTCLPVAGQSSLSAVTCCPEANQPTTLHGSNVCSLSLSFLGWVLCQFIGLLMSGPYHCLLPETRSSFPVHPVIHT